VLLSVKYLQGTAARLLSCDLTLSNGASDMHAVDKISSFSRDAGQLRSNDERSVTNCCRECRTACMYRRWWSTRELSDCTVGDCWLR